MTLRKAALPLIVAVLVAVVFGYCYRQSRSEWERRAADAVTRADSLQKRVRVLTDSARLFENRADTLSSKAAKADTIIRQRIVRVRAETPDSLAHVPAVVERDAIIDSLQIEVSDLRSAFESEKEANARLHMALDRATERGDTLAAVLKDRPKPPPWFIPKIVLGPSAGLQTTGKPYTGVGVTLGWEIHF